MQAVHSVIKFVKFIKLAIPVEGQNSYKSQILIRKLTIGIA